MRICRNRLIVSAENCRRCKSVNFVHLVMRLPLAICSPVEHAVLLGWVEKKLEDVISCDSANVRLQIAAIGKSLLRTFRTYFRTYKFTRGGKYWRVKTFCSCSCATIVRYNLVIRTSLLSNDLATSAQQ